MSQKNKIFSITLSLLILGSVACRKSGGGGGPTQTDPIKNLTGNLLIVSADGTRGANSLPLSFVGASATVSDVKVEQFGGQGGDILLFPTNFILVEQKITFKSWLLNLYMLKYLKLFA